MGLSGISPLSLILILAIVILLFGTKRLRTFGKDLGEAVKGFHQGVAESTQDEKVDDEQKPLS